MHRFLLTFALALVLLPLAAAGSAADAAPSIIVKLRSTGAHAVNACAETRGIQNRPLADATADGSASLDEIMQRYGVRNARAIFRRPDGRGLQHQTNALRQRYADARKRRPSRARRVSAIRSDPGTLAHVYRMELRSDASLGEALAALSADPHVEYAQPNFTVSRDRELDDPFLASSGSWGRAFPDLWGLERIGVPEAWDRTLGEGTLIAIVDSGIDTRHPDLVENLWVHPGEDLDGDGIADPEESNGIDDDGNGFVDDLHGFDFNDSVDANEDGDYSDPEDVSDPDPFDFHGHGTHVAGTAAARGGNGIGIAGVAPRARVMGVKIFPDRGGSADTAKAWRGVLYAAENGADVINASWSCSPRCPSNPIGEEVTRLVHDLGVVFVTTAGNRADDATFTSPERLAETITVGAGDPDGSLASFSSFGWIVDVIAPGVEVLSLKLEDASIWEPFRFVGEDYMFLNGTSMAAPHVTGVVALMLAADPTLGVDEIRARLRRTAEDVGELGPDRRFGNGWVRADQALADSARPDALARFDSDLIGGQLEPMGEPLPIAGTIAGADVTRAVLAVGETLDPDTWQDLAELPPGRFSHPWDVSSRPDGAYVLRLTVETRSGLSFTEYAPLSLDRNPPVFVSPRGTTGTQPDVAGDRVVWSARRIENGAFTSDLELELGTFGVEGGEFLDLGIGTQRAAVLSSRALVWQERPASAEGNDRDGLAGCMLRGSASTCSPVAIATDPQVIRSRPALAGNRVVYGERIPGGFELLACRLTGSSCATRVIAPIGSRAPEPRFDGARVLFVDRIEGEMRLLTCRMPPPSRLCTPRPTSLSSFLHLSPKGFEDDIVVFDDADPRSGLQFVYRLQACRLDAASGACPPVEIATSRAPFDADFSEGRVFWSNRTEAGPPDLWLCRFDPVRGLCPAQRITADPSSQSRGRIDGHRLVWEDEREGVTRIASLALPTLAPLHARRVRAGHVLAFGVRETTGIPNARFEAFTETGQPVESLGVRMVEPRPGRLHVRWRPGAADVGTHVLRFRVSLPDGLYDERSVRIEVAPGRGER